MTTKIEWCTDTINPVIGCSKVSNGCERCYAEKQARRLATFPHTAERYVGLTKDGKWIGKTNFVPSELEKPLRWRKPRTIFACSMGDLFHEDVTDEQIAAVFGVIAACPQHTFKILTKRAERLPRWFEWAQCRPTLDERFGAPAPVVGYLYEHAIRLSRGKVNGFRRFFPPWPLPNLHIGVSIEDQDALRRALLLARTPAAARFLSIEPMLAPTDLDICSECGGVGLGRHGSGEADVDGAERECGPPLLDVIDQVIVGCESGPKRRETKLDWVRNVRNQCVTAGVSLFVKQLDLGDGKVTKMPDLDGKVWGEQP